MRDLNQVINFYIALYPCSFPGNCGAVDSAIGADFHIIIYLYKTHLGDFSIVASGSGKAESISTYNNTGV